MKSSASNHPEPTCWRYSFSQCRDWDFHYKTSLRKIYNVTIAVGSVLLAFVPLVAQELSGDFSITSIRVLNDGKLELHYRAVDDSYYILYRGNLATEVENAYLMELGIQGTAKMTISTDERSEAFYRMKKILKSVPEDLDGDGFDDVYELDHPESFDPLIPNNGNQRFAANRFTAGHYYNLVIREDGSLWGWGVNSYGELGDGTGRDSLVPIQIGKDTNWKAIHSDNSRTVALKEDGSLWAWGWNERGQLGDGTQLTRLKPTRIGTQTSWKTLDAGYYHTLAIKEDGSLWGWGWNEYGQLGHGSTVSAELQPVQIGGDTKWFLAEAGNEYSLGIRKDGSLWAWGRNHVGQLGIGTVVDQKTLIRVGTSVGWQFIATGYSSNFALHEDGSLWAWGLNDVGQLGIGSKRDQWSPIRIGADTDWKMVTVGFGNVYALKQNGTLWGWGKNLNGVLSLSLNDNQYLTPVQIGTDSDWAAIDAGLRHVMAVKGDGSLWVFGENFNGQFGNGVKTAVPRILEPTIIKQGSAWIDLSAGSDHSLAVRSDGALYAWGWNRYGQLGNGTVNNLPFPDRIGLEMDWKSVATASSFSVGLRENGTLWMWGYTGSSTGLTRTPKLISSDGGWKIISVGDYTAAAVHSNGSLWTWWGDDGPGFLGDGSTSDRWEPFQIGTNDDWTSVDIGERHAVALRNDGSLWAWGQNSNGELGDSTVITRLEPIPIQGVSPWKFASAGGRHTVAIQSDGSLWAWGYNGTGQLGNGSTGRTLEPTRIGTDLDWLMVDAGQSHTVALRKDGSLWAWGRNWYGELGDGTFGNFSTIPKRIGDQSDWKTLKAGDVHTVALKENGSLWAWGQNRQFQVGVFNRVNGISLWK